jgi:putative oxidoreductase
MGLGFLNQYREWGITALRVIVGIVFLVHGLQKLLQFGVEGTTGFLAGIGVPLAGVAAILLIAAEAVGGLALILGAFTRWVGIVLAFVMLVAIFTVHLPNGFFANNSGYEYVLTLLVANITLVLAGSGPLAVDQVLEGRGGAQELAGQRS